MDSERRSCIEGRARFPLYKAHVASSLPQVEQLMPKPWFEDLVCRMARVRIRCELNQAAPEAPAAATGIPPAEAVSPQPSLPAAIAAPSPTPGAGTASR